MSDIAVAGSVNIFNMKLALRPVPQFDFDLSTRIFSNGDE